MGNKPICKIDQCGKPSRSLGWCGAHYMRWKRHGDPTAGNASPTTKYGEPLAFFLETVLLFTGERCLKWPYAKDSFGYGHLVIDGRDQRVHREACIRLHGDAPNSKSHAAHTCGNGHLGCCNPTHIRWASPAENARDKIEHGTILRGEKCSFSKLKEDDILKIRELSGQISQRKISKTLGISQSLVSLIVNRKTWRHVP